MRLFLAVALLLPLSAPAWAQAQSNGNSVIAVPLAPPVVAAPPTPVAPVAPLAPPPPGLVQTPVPPANQDVPATQVPNVLTGTPPAGAAPATAAPTAPPDAAPVIPNTWVPGTTATLGVLNEVDGVTAKISVPVGGQSVIGDLQVSVQACDTRPPNELPDAAIFLTVTPTGGDASSSTLYRGWMVRSTPGATVVGDGSETFRVIGCS